MIQKVTCFYRYNEKSQNFEFNHYETGWKDSPDKDVNFQPGKWYSNKEFKCGHVVSTNGVFKPCKSDMVQL